MGEIEMKGQHLDRLLADSTSPHGASYQNAFEQLAESHRGKPATDILPLLRRAAEESLLEFTGADLREQAEAPACAASWSMLSPVYAPSAVNTRVGRRAPCCS
ncbi:hypothetical protein [Streptomyces brevispora]|uniref:Uncharacterized protein n=1 Tax=Streptomyces brevispora TaxID=887462 RepID=A0A561TYS1_9ACTN|nr:hypothetical protein [Streptomyces brevispora]TWF92265.1 hypothetical protein FHX80_12585 [Streptomyces brevispora]WSC11446.1 hypothetical protein OIE64_00135 [Streptomyces brevispora]WSC17665.1 hypothetical protein OIE64_35905 [Streptomyces brevispora]